MKKLLSYILAVLLIYFFIGSTVFSRMTVEKPGNHTLPDNPSCFIETIPGLFLLPASQAKRVFNPAAGIFKINNTAWSSSGFLPNMHLSCSVTSISHQDRHTLKFRSHIVNRILRL